MQFFYTILEISAGACLAVAVNVFLLPYWKNYWSRKAANQADKEDIQELTEAIESIKHQNQTLLSQIDLQHRNKFSLADEERKAIFAVYEAIYELVGFLNILPSNPKYLSANTNVFTSDFVEIAMRIMHSVARLNLLRLEFGTRAYPIIQRILAFSEPAIQKFFHSTDMETARKEITELLKKMEQEDVHELCLVLHEYLQEPIRG